MKSSVLLACLLAGGMTGAAVAADLDEGYPPDRRGSSYDDQRYSDVYRYPDRPPPPAYGAPPPPRAEIYREDEYSAYPRRYADRPPPYAGRCTPREEIRYRLQSQGWHAFHDVDIRGELVTVRARRPSGRLFDLTVDRCSGEVVNARPVLGPPLGPYAYGPPPRRWDRPFY